MTELATVFGQLDRDDTVRVAVLYGEGKMFTSGLDLLSVAAHIQHGN